MLATILEALRATKSSKWGWAVTIGGYVLLSALQYYGIEALDMPDLGVHVNVDYATCKLVVMGAGQAIAHLLPDSTKDYADGLAAMGQEKVQAVLALLPQTYAQFPTPDKNGGAGDKVQSIQAWKAQ